MARAYQDQEIRDRLSADLPGWELVDGHLSRRFETGDWRRTNLVAGAIAFLGEAAFHHPDLTLTYPGVEVRLRSHDDDAITDRDFELAARIEEVVSWRPAAGSALDGPPDDWIR